MKNNNLILGLICLSLTVIGFLGGIKYQHSKIQTTSFNRGQFAQNGIRQNNNGGFRTSGQTVGEILSSDAKSITVKLMDGGSKIIFVSSTTSIIKSIPATISDLSVGVKVGVFGQTNTDGSVTAQNIQLNPMSRLATPSATTSQ